MSFIVRELPRAKLDKRRIVEWLVERSRTGAAAWLDAYDQMVSALAERAGSFAEAEENADLPMEVKQALFKTRRGRVYRIVFLIEEDSVYILRVRGPGQAPLSADEVSSLS